MLALHSLSPSSIRTHLKLPRFFLCTVAASLRAKIDPPAKLSQLVRFVQLAMTDRVALAFGNSTSDWPAPRSTISRPGWNTAIGTLS
jgi:hypothetical protein